MYKLAENRAFSLFEKVYLFSTPQDGLCPYYSTRGQVFDEEFKETHSEDLFKMGRNLVKGTKKLHRVDVIFNEAGTRWDNLIGRTEHIAFTDHFPFLHLFVVKYVSEWCKP